jgi:hypothetical protein
MESIRIPLTQGKYATIDTDQLDVVLRFRWTAYKHGLVWYARGRRELEYGWHTVSLHHLILAVPSRIHIDHIDRDGLNNTRQNLRVCTHTENMLNRRLFASNSSGYRGVSPNPHGGKPWRAQITDGGTKHMLGTFDTAEDAARAFDVAAREFRGTTAIANFPD